jgi:antitoxin (DNA-binding transcriptional repressor) of toxin-antitoxin stability system
VTRVFPADVWDVPEAWREYPLCWLAYGEREGCVRESSPFWDDDVLAGVKTLLYWYHHYLADELEAWLPLDSMKAYLCTYIDPSYEDSSQVIVIQPSTNLVVFTEDIKAWNFCFDTPDDLANSLDEDFHEMAELIEDAKAGTKLIITVQGGLIQEIIADQPCRYLTIDKDIENYEEGDLAQMTDPDGTAFEASLVESSAGDDVAEPDKVEHYWNQIPPV